MRPIDIESFEKEGWVLINYAGKNVLSVPLSSIPTINPIRAAGGCRCGEWKINEGKSK